MENILLVQEKSVGAEKMDDMIKEALALYGMEASAYELIRHNENVTCKVDHEGKRYVLRIHHPVHGFEPSIVTEGMDPAELFYSEVELLRYMAGNGFEEVQKPVAALSGEYTAKLENGSPVMMLTWVDGHPLSQEDSKKYARDISRLACRIHRASEGFAGKRPHYDTLLTDRMVNEIHNAITSGHITKEDGDGCIRELKAIRNAQERLDSYVKPSIIHADLGLSNILVTESGLVPIDFSFAGFSHPAQEAGMIMSNYQDEDGFEEILRGFGDGGIQISKEDSEMFLAYSVLLFICMQHAKCCREEWFGRAMKRWCTTLFVH